MAAELADSIQDIKCENTLNQRPVDTPAHIYLVNRLEETDAIPESHIRLASAKARNDEPDEDKDEECENIQTEAPGGKVIVNVVPEKWPIERSYQKEEEEEAQEEERRDLW